VRVLLLLVIAMGCGGGDGDEADARPGADARRPIDAAETAEIDAAGPDPVDAAAPVDAVAPVDARADARPVMIEAVPCDGAVIAVELTTSVTSYFPAAMTIQVGEVIRFAPSDPHDVMAGTPAAPEPTWFAIAGNDPQCVRFDEVGVFPFFCTAHPSSMVSAVTVEP
jgi:plastocyanin